MRDLVKDAESLARRAHDGQLDKAGAPYIEHVARVALAVRGDDIAEAVAWLHDVMEDCPDFEEELADNFPYSVLYPVHLLTRFPATKGDMEGFYYAAIKKNQTALKVKLADIADNANEERLAQLDARTASRLRKKYRRAMDALSCP